MEMKINQINAAGQRHGYWEKYQHKVHYYYGKRVGYEKLHIFGWWNSYYINDENIGCELYSYISIHNSNKIQCFRNKLGNKFGEEIKWK